MAYPTIDAWLKAQRRLILEDWDVVLLFTGDEGAGKTTWAFQIMKALDPSFGLEDVHFLHKNFLAYASKGHRGQAVLWDEGRLNRRRAMHGSTLEVLDFLQDCRGLNLILGVCFPHEKLLDDAVKDHRVRWRWHIPHRGRAELWERATRRDRRGQEQYYWRPTGDVFDFKPNKGPLWEGYKAMKEEHMRRKAQASAADEAGLLDVEAGRRFLAQLQ